MDRRKGILEDSIKMLRKLLSETQVPAKKLALEVKVPKRVRSAIVVYGD